MLHWFMQFTLVNPPKIFARNASGRVVQISGRAGDVGRFENVVVPEERVIRHLKPVVKYIEKLPHRPFDYGMGSGYSKHQQQPQQNPLKVIQFNRTDDLPLFKKQPSV